MLNYRLDGSGPPLLLLHGFGISFNIWSGLHPFLSDHFTLVTVELPGIGLSPLPPPTQPYLAAALDALESTRTSLDLPRWNILSYSSGTRVAEEYLRIHPDRVERAVFLCPALTVPLKAAGLRAAIQLDRRFPPLGNYVLSGWRIRFLIELLGFNLKRNLRGRIWFNEITSQPVEILKETLRSMPAGGARPFALPAEIPSLFVWGHEDLIAANPHQPSVRDILIHATHAAPQTKARAVADAILPFLMEQRDL